MTKKILYSFNVNKTLEVEKREPSKDANGNDIEVVKKVKEETPVKVIIYKPSKKQTDDANFEYGKHLNRMLNEGFLTKAMLSKSYKDKGGVFSEEEMKLYNKLRAELLKNQDELIRLGAIKEKNEEAQKKWEDLVGEQEVLRSNLMEIESSFNTLFDHTAEKRAENHVILWYAFFLTYLQEDLSKDPVIYFQGDTFNEKEEDYYNKEEEESEFHRKVRDGVLLAISFWIYSNAQGPEDFAFLDEELNKDIKVEEPTEVKAKKGRVKKEETA